MVDSLLSLLTFSADTIIAHHVLLALAGIAESSKGKEILY